MSRLYVFVLFLCFSVLSTAQNDHFYNYEYGFDRHMYDYSDSNQIQTLHRKIYDVSVNETGDTVYYDRFYRDYNYNYLADSKIEFNPNGQRLSRTYFFPSMDSISFDTFCYGEVKPDIDKRFMINEKPRKSYHIYWNDNILYSERLWFEEGDFEFHDAFIWTIESDYESFRYTGTNEAEIEYREFDSLDSDYEHSIVKVIVTFDTGPCLKSFYSYYPLPDSLRVLSAVEVGGDNLQERYTYDSIGNIIKFWSRSDIQTERYELYSFDSFNNQSSHHIYDSNWTWLWGVTSEFNKNGRLMKSIGSRNTSYHFDKFDSIFYQPYQIVLQRNKYDSVTHHTYVDVWNKDTTVYESKFEYDSLHRLTRKSFYTAGVLNNEVYYTYTSENLIKSKTFYWMNPYLKCYEPYREKHFEYDEKGNLKTQYNKKIGFKTRDLVLREIIKYDITYYE